jgi:hypothetical protein
VFLLENLLGSPPPPPPDDVPPVKETLGATLRERLKAHRELPACAGCHARIDPLGFALENFNAIGKWRSVEEETRLPIDASGELPDGRAFANFPEFRTLLLSRETDLVRCLTEKLLVYALGRPVHAGDETLIQEIMQAAAAEGNTLAALVTAIASSPAFTHR